LTIRQRKRSLETNPQKKSDADDGKDRKQQTDSRRTPKATTTTKTKPEAKRASLLPVCLPFLDKTTADQNKSSTAPNRVRQKRDERPK
jgi:hypothetical protein